MSQLEAQGELKRITHPVSPHLEMTEIGDRVLKAGGPALLFTQPQAGDKRYDTPVLANLFGTPKRVAMGMGASDVMALREIGQTLAYLKEPEPPKRLSRCLGQVAATEAGIVDGTKRSAQSPLPGNRVGRRRGRPVAPAYPALLAGRRGPADYLGPHRYPRPAQEAAKLGYLPPASHRPQPRDHALAGAPRRRAGLPRIPCGQP